MASTNGAIELIHSESGIAEAMKWAFENGSQVQCAKDMGEIVDIDNVKFLRQHGKYTPFNLPEPSQPEKMNLTSLDGFVDFIKKDVDDLFRYTASQYYALINTQSVQLVTQLRGRQNLRHTIVRCEFTPDRIPFSQWLDSEEMIILLQTRFVATDERDMVMKIVGNLNQEQAIQTADDGVSQKVVVRSGIQSNITTVFKNPVPLRPYRTFFEVEQVESPFVLRIKEGGKVALFDADGGMWAIKARENIRNYLDVWIGDKVQTIV